jgi:predicted acylesterase/phospholipase RssA
MTSKPLIKHLVLSGGGITGFSSYGVLRESHKSGFWDIKNIETIFCTSVGALFAVSISLIDSFSWDIYDDFYIKRPWHHLFDFSMHNILQSYDNMGIFKHAVVENIMKPIFNALDLSVDITLKEFYEFNHIDMHFITSEINMFKMVDLSHTTHPDWRVVDAMYCSCCLPVLFAPHIHENEIYMDGALFQNCPIQACLDHGAKPCEVLCVNKIYETSYSQTPVLNTMLDYLLFLFQKVLDKVAIDQPNIPYTVNIVSTPITLYDIYKGTSNVDNRKQLIQDGVNAWTRFFEDIHVYEDEPLEKYEPLEKDEPTPDKQICEHVSVFQFKELPFYY